LGCCNRRFWIEAGTLFFNFLAFPILGNWLVLVDYDSGVFYVANRQKRQGYRFAGYFVYGWFIIASLLPSLGYTGRLFISPAAAVIFFIGCLDVVYAVKLLS
jgi:protoheme IX farnesyltransferase